MKKIVVCIVLVQIIIISVLLVNLFKKKQLSTSISVNPISTSSQLFTQVDSLKYFHEPSTSFSYMLPGNREVSDIINKDHLKNLDNYSIQKGKKVFRIITIGDSFTYGLNESTQDIWPERLQGLLNSELKCGSSQKFEVINLGVPGYDIQYELARYKLRGKKYNPDLVVWMVLDNDLDNIEEEIAPLINTYVKEIKSEGVSENNLKFNIDNQGKYHNYFISFYLRAINELKNGKMKNSRTFQIAKLEEFGKLYQKTLVLYGLEHALDNEANIAAFTSFAKSRQGTYFYRETNDNWYQHTLSDKHPDSTGHMIIAMDIFNYLKSNKLVSCQN